MHPTPSKTVQWITILLLCYGVSFNSYAVPDQGQHHMMSNPPSMPNTGPWGKPMMPNPPTMPNTNPWGKPNVTNWGSMMSMGEGHMTARLRAVWTLSLTDEQRSTIRDMQKQLRKSHWELEDKIEIAADQLFELYQAKPRDAKAIGKVYGEVFDYRRQIIELAINAGNDVESVLTEQQRQQLKQQKPQRGWGGMIH